MKKCPFTKCRTHIGRALFCCRLHWQAMSWVQKGDAKQLIKLETANLITAYAARKVRRSLVAEVEKCPFEAD